MAAASRIAIMMMAANPSAPITPPDCMTEAEAEKRLTHDRGDIVALVAKADHRRDAGDNRASNAYYRAAVRQSATMANMSPAVQQQIDRAVGAVAWFDQLFKTHLIASLTEAGYPRERQHPRFRQSLDIMLGATPRPSEYRQYPQTPLQYYYPGTEYQQFADTERYNWVPALEAQFPAMKTEALALLANHSGFTPYVKASTQRPQSNHHGLLDNPNWSTLYLWENGGPVEEHIKRCPKIFQAIIEHVPLCRIGPRAPSVMLSLLRPGARIPPHTGMLNSRLICHLPLIVPPDCGFRVGNQTIEWQEGRVIAFDDTVEHEAWNNSAFDRLVLIFDVWRPELSLTEQEQIVAMFAAVDSY